MASTSEQVPGSTTISRAQVHAVVDSADRSIEQILGAVEACDHARAATLAFARAASGEDLPAEVVAAILPGLRDQTLATRLLAIATGDRASAWLAAVRERRFPELRDAASIECITLYAAWRAGAAAELIVPEARRISHTELIECGHHALLYELAQGIADANLRTATADFRACAASELGVETVAMVEDALAGSVAEHLDELPAEVVAPQVPAGFTVRVGPRVGRNEPCPCGSGQKYKRCCIDKVAQVAASPIAGLSWDEYVTTAADRITPEDVRLLSLRDLARVDLGGLDRLALISAFRRLTAERLWTRSAHAVDQLARRPDELDADGLRDELVAEALRAGAVDVASRELAKMRDPADPMFRRLELDLRLRQGGTLDALARAADLAVRDEDPLVALDLAFALLGSMPALGILVARGCMDEGSDANAETLLDAIEDARDQLGLPPVDPAWEVRAALSGDADEADRVDRAAPHDDAEHERIRAEASALQSSLRATTSRLGHLEHQLATTQRELDAARRERAASPAAPAEAPIEPERLRRLRSKVDELEGLVRAGNSERSDLRRQVAAATATVRTPTSPPPARAGSHDDDPDAEPIDLAERGVAIPSLSRRVHDALGTVPRAIAAEALRTLGSLAAGDASVWRSAKQAKDMSRPVLMARIGIHHRLLFRVEDGALEVWDLVTREELPATLKRLRAARG